MKKIITGMAVLMTAAVFAAAAHATSYQDVDIDYSGVLGSYYEIDSGSAAAQVSSRIPVTADVSYDAAEKMFYYYAADITKPFTSSVMDGMITSGQVVINVPEGIAAELYRDGEICSDPLDRLSAPGGYVLRVKSNSGVSVPVLSFTLIGERSGAVSAYKMPEGFAINSVTLNGENIPVSGDTAEFAEEGSYTVSYRCSATGVNYSLSVVTDRTAPVLKLEAVKDGKAWGPVDISDAEPGCSVAIYRNGEPEPFSAQLTKSGQYELSIKDPAGNQTDYRFTIMIYFNSGSIIFFAAVAVILAAVGIYVIIARKRLRVR